MAKMVTNKMSILGSVWQFLRPNTFVSADERWQKWSKKRYKKIHTSDSSNNNNNNNHDVCFCICALPVLVTFVRADPAAERREYNHNQ